VACVTSVNISDPQPRPRLVLAKAAQRTNLPSSETTYQVRELLAFAAKESKKSTNHGTVLWRYTPIARVALPHLELARPLARLTPHKRGNCWSMPRRFMCLERFDACTHGLARSLDCDCVRARCEDTLALLAGLARLRDGCRYGEVYIKERRFGGLHSVRVISFWLLAFITCCRLVCYYLLPLLLLRLPRGSTITIIIRVFDRCEPFKRTGLSCETTRLTPALHRCWLCASRDVYGPAACAPIVEFPEACTSAFSDCRKRRGLCQQVRE
jgi:hypothetical protein